MRLWVYSTNATSFLLERVTALNIIAEFNVLEKNKVNKKAAKQVYALQLFCVLQSCLLYAAEKVAQMRGAV